MRRGQIVLFSLLPFAAVTPALAQTVQVLAPNQLTAAGPEALMARVMSFDRNNDGRISSDELNERMQPLLVWADANGDRALDSSEVRSLAKTPAPRQIRGFPAVEGRYGFRDDSVFSSRLHIEGALDDLRLAAVARERALPVVRDFLDTWENSSRAALLKDLHAVLTAEQLAAFTQKLETREFPRFPITDARITQRLSQADRPVVEGLLSTIMGQGFAQYQRQASQMLAAIERFCNRTLGDSERSALLDRMAGILSDEERDDFRAALERRPVVKTGSAVGRVTVQFNQNVTVIREPAKAVATGVAP
jgi:hypothetical protein